jgi:hypothetical protein
MVTERGAPVNPGKTGQGTKISPKRQGAACTAVLFRPEGVAAGVQGPIRAPPPPCSTLRARSGENGGWQGAPAGGAPGKRKRAGEGDRGRSGKKEAGRQGDRGRSGKKEAGGNLIGGSPARQGAADRTDAIFSAEIQRRRQGQLRASGAPETAGQPLHDPFRARRERRPANVPMPRRPARRQRRATRRRSTRSPRCSSRRVPQPASLLVFPSAQQPAESRTAAPCPGVGRPTRDPELGGGPRDGHAVQLIPHHRVQLRRGHAELIHGGMEQRQGPTPEDLLLDARRRTVPALEGARLLTPLPHGLTDVRPHTLRMTLRAPALSCPVR